MNAWGTLRQSSQRAVATLSISLLVAGALTATATAEPTTAPTASLSPTASPTASVESAEITISAATAGTREVGVGTNIWGVATGAPNTEITVQALVDGAWQNSQRSQTDATGFYALPLTYGSNTAGTHTFRTYVRTSDGRVYYSNEVLLTRTPPAVSVTAATAGSREVGVGTNIWGRASGAPNATITAQVKLGTSWSNSSSGRTDSSGSYALPLTYGATTPGTYTFRTVVTTAGPRYHVSPEVTLVRTRPAVTVYASTAGTAMTGTNANVWGTAVGAPDAAVSVQALVGGSWSTSRTGRTDSRGFYALPLTYGQNAAGTHTFRTVVTVAGRHYVSPTVTLTRTRLDSRCYTSGTVLCASKTDRKAYYLRSGKVIRVMDARFGGWAPDANGVMKLYDTKEGVHYVTRKVRDEVSYSYNNTPMPFAVYFYKGQAFHYSYGFAANGWNGASHGCINLRSWTDAEWLFNNTRVGDKVVVYK